MDQTTNLSQSSPSPVSNESILTLDSSIINPTSQTTQDINIKYAGFGIRLLAYIIDVFLFRVLVGFIGLYIGAAIYLFSNNPLTTAANLSNNLSDFGYLDLASYLLPILYFSVFLALFSTTPGKYLCKLRVLGENNLPINVVSSFVRSLLQPFSTLLFGIGYVSLLKDPKKRAWHDKVAKTIVVHIKESKHYYKTLILSLAILIFLFIITSLLAVFNRL